MMKWSVFAAFAAMASFAAYAVELPNGMQAAMDKKVRECQATGVSEDYCACKLGGDMFATRSPLVYAAPTREDQVAFGEDTRSKAGARCAVRVGMDKDWANKDPIPGCIKNVKTYANTSEKTATTACACILGSDIAASAFRDATDAPKEKVQEEKRLDADVCVQIFAH